MTSIFSCTDEDGDGLRVDTRDTGDFLALRIPYVPHLELEGRGVNLPRAQVRELHAALGEWLYPVHTPEAPNRSLIEQMIERNVREQVAAILPLHLVPFATQMQAAEDKVGRIANALMTGPKPGDVTVHNTQACRDIGCWCTQDDPEPGDVGHPRPAVSPCGLCGHEGSGHDDDCNSVLPVHQVSEADCRAPVCGAQHLDGIHGRLMSELPRRVRQYPAPCTAPLRPGARLAEVHEDCGYVWYLHQYGPATPKCSECLHGWGEHTASVCWGTIPGIDGGSCRCTRERPE